MPYFVDNRVHKTLLKEIKLGTIVYIIKCIPHYKKWVNLRVLLLIRIPKANLLRIEFNGENYTLTHTLSDNVCY